MGRAISSCDAGSPHISDIDMIIYDVFIAIGKKFRIILNPLF